MGLLSKTSLRTAINLGVTLGWPVLLYSGAILLVFSLVRYGQKAHLGNDFCNDRRQTQGFIGDPDFYGLGIRLGIYLQWIAQFIANWFLPDDWKAGLGASMAFDLALIIAVLLRIFANGCTFTAEIIVILFICWGNFAISFYGSPAAWAFRKPHESSANVGTGIAADISYLCTLLITLCFWLRLAVAGEVDYTPTPGGTFYFLFTKVSIASRAGILFMTCLSALLATSIVAPLIWTAYMVYAAFCHVIRIMQYSIARRKPLAASVARPESLRFANPITLLDGRVNDLYACLRAKLQNRQNEEFVSGLPSELPEVDVQAISVYLICLYIATIIYSVISIETTLIWNGITSIYNISSTGQVIPFIIGFGVLINTAWKLSKPWLDDEGSNSTDLMSTREPHISTPKMVFQDPTTSRWV